MSRPDPRNVCDGCGRSLDRRLRSHVELGPIVHSHIWRQLANDPRERLCCACMYQSFERAPPSNLAEWRSVGEPGELAPLNFPPSVREPVDDADVGGSERAR